MIKYLPLLLVLALGCSGSCSQPETPGEERPGLVRLHFSTFHLCALDDEGKVWCSGGNAEGQLGDGTTIEKAGLVQVLNLENIAGIAVGLFDTSCAWNEAGEVFCWGSNSRGVLAGSTLERSAVPVKIEGLPPVREVTMGAYHACALTDDLQVYCWGATSQGQVGLGDAALAEPISPPTLIEVLPPVAKIRAGAEHTCAMSDRGSLFCWGSNSHGQLGLGSDSILRATRPQAVPFLPDDAVDFDLSFNHSCALIGPRRLLYCWGNNDYGQLGLDDLERRHSPTAAPEIADVDELAMGGAQVCARIEDEGVYCAGEVLRPVEVARQTGEGYVFRRSETLHHTTEMWSGILAICGPVDDESIACRGIEQQALGF